MTRYAVAVALLLFLLVAGIAVVVTEIFAIQRRVTSTTLELSADARLGQLLEISTTAARDLHEMSDGFGIADPMVIAESGLFETMDSYTAAEMLETTSADLYHTLLYSNAGHDFASPPEPTGDLLFDHYALVLDEIISERGIDDITFKVSLPVIPDEELAWWVEEFGDDPRYWELRYISLLLGSEILGDNGELPPEAFLYNSLRIRQAVWFLRTAHERGVATANTLLLLYGEESRECWLTPVRSKGLRHAKPPKPGRIELLDEAVELAPDAAWPRYFRAFHYFETGDTATALAEMAAGNALPVNEHPRPFPLQRILSGLTDTAPAGSAVVSGAGLTLARDYPITYIGAMERYLKQTVLYIDRTGDLAALENWHQFCCRYARSWPEDPLPPLVSLSFLSQIGEYMRRQVAADTTEERRTGLQLAFLARNKAHNELKRSAGDCSVQDMMVSLGMVAQARGACLAQYLYAEHQAQYLLDRVQPVIDDIGTLHYPALEPPAGLDKYAPRK